MAVDAAVAAYTAHVFRVVEVDRVECLDRCVEEPRLVLFHAEDVVPAASDDDLRGLSLGVHRVCGDDPARKGKGCEQRSESKNLIRLIVLDVALTDHHSGVVTKRCQQLDLGTICSLRTSHRLAIDRYTNEVCPGATTTVGVGGVAVVLDIRRCRARVHRCPPPAICLFTSQGVDDEVCLLYTSPSPRDRTRSRMPSSA